MNLQVKRQLAYWESVLIYILEEAKKPQPATYCILVSGTKFLKDKGFAPTEEPFKKLINQGMILGDECVFYRLVVTSVVGGRNEFGQDTVWG
ncbi:hypothetical protein [Flavobacterium procerum]|uniref:hypothetical protein n=1 Tax=Flavobacterium procerum TaxID=1455569 RepID=UPI00406BCC8F